MADERHDDFDEPAGEEWDEAEGSALEPDLPSGNRRGCAIAIIVVAVFVVLAMLCCGGVSLWIYSGTDIKQTTEARQIRDWTDQMLVIDLPTDYAPAHGTRTSLVDAMSFTVVSYDGPGEMRIHLVEATGPFPNDAATRRQLTPSLRNFITQIPEDRGKVIRAETSKIHEVMIADQRIDFHLATGPTLGSGKSTWRELTGTVPGKRGVVYVAIQAPKEKFDKKAALAIVESIGGGPEAEAKSEK